ncbi:hypothetical protein [Pseudodesulfovibrio profundus]|nr:hypothetical protein [Pseudodesulfovibrio profundus]
MMHMMTPNTMAHISDIADICKVVTNPSHIHWAGSPENISAH